MPPDVAGQCDDTVCAAGEGTRAQLRLRILSEVLNTHSQPGRRQVPGARGLISPSLRFCSLARSRRPGLYLGTDSQRLVGRDRLLREWDLQKSRAVRESTRCVLASSFGDESAFGTSGSGKQIKALQNRIHGFFSSKKKPQKTRLLVPRREVYDKESNKGKWRHGTCAVVRPMQFRTH
jgi:hypothetical protein